MIQNAKIQNVKENAAKVATLASTVTTTAAVSIKSEVSQLKGLRITRRGANVITASMSVLALTFSCMVMGTLVSFVKGEYGSTLTLGIVTMVLFAAIVLNLSLNPGYKRKRSDSLDTED